MTKKSYQTLFTILCRQLPITATTRQEFLSPTNTCWMHFNSSLVILGSRSHHICGLGHKINITFMNQTIVRTLKWNIGITVCNYHNMVVRYGMVFYSILIIHLLLITSILRKLSTIVFQHSAAWNRAALSLSLSRTQLNKVWTGLSKKPTIEFSLVWTGNADDETYEV